MADNELIHGDDGRIYKKNADGRLSEVFDPKSHAERLLSSITEGHVITGLRISDSADPDAPGIVVTLAPDESERVLAAVRDVLQDRTL